MKRSVLLHASGVGVAILASSAPIVDARAEEAEATIVPEVAEAARDTSVPRFELFARGGYVAPPVRGGITPFGLGGGGGLALAIGPVYLGGSLVAYAGGSDDAGTSERALLYGGEIGFEMKLTPVLTLRPFFGAGGAAITHSTQDASATTTTGRNVRSTVDAPDVITQATSVSSGSTGSRSSTSDTVVSTYYLEPGIAAILSSRSGTFVGLRLSALYFPRVAYGTDASATWLPWALHLTIGQRF